MQIACLAPSAARPAAPAAAAARDRRRRPGATAAHSGLGVSSSGAVQPVPYRLRQHQRSHVATRVRLSELGDSADDADALPSAKALREYFELEQSGAASADARQAIRQQYGIRRQDDGRVHVQRSSDGVWMQVKLDMEVSGTILFRDTSNDEIWALQTERLQQVDLSDDYMVFMLFAGDEWEEEMVPIQLVEDGQAESASTLQMDEQQFKDHIGIIKTLQDMEASDRAGRGGGGSDDSDTEIDVQAEPVNPASGR